MEFTRQRREKGSLNKKYIVHSHIGVVKRIVGILISLVMWVYMAVVFLLFFSACFEYNDERLSVLKSALKTTNRQIRHLVAWSVIGFIVSFIILGVWKLYNKRRYGRLHRRKMPADTTDEDMLGLNLIEPEVYYALKAKKIIILDQSPVRELYKENSNETD